MAPGVRLKTADGTPARPLRSRAWLALGAAMAFGALPGWWIPQDAWNWQAALWLHQPWRLWTAAWVHLDLQHLMANLVGAVVVTVYGWAARCRRSDALAWLAAWPLGHAALALAPAVQVYAGMSGALHAGVAVAVVSLLLHGRGGERVIGGVTGLGLLAKLALESPLTAPVHPDPAWAFPVVVLAHTTGAMAGVCCALVAFATTHGWRNARMHR